MKNSWKQLLRSSSLRKKIALTLGLIVVYKLLSVIPVPGVSNDSLASMRTVFSAQPGLAFFSSLMGGSLERFSIILMGLSPYINASIILQLLSVVVPKLEEIKKEGASGQKKINTYTRILTVPLAFVQSYGMILLLNSLTSIPVVDTSDWTLLLSMMTTITAGTIFLMWLGEQINESGIGNGISMIIFAGVLAEVPGRIATQLGSVDWSGSFGGIFTQMLPFLGLLVATLLVIYIIIRFTEGYRRIPLVYTRTGRDERSYFPIRISQAGMVPIIFAMSLVTFPYIIGQAIALRSAGMPAFVRSAADLMVQIFNPNAPTWWFVIIFVVLVLGFSFFYISITFDTKEVADGIQKRGGYIPGIRPGRQTADYLRKVSNHLNFFGGSFIALVAVFPYVATLVNNALKARNIPALDIAQIDFLVSGAGLIIVVGVILELLRKFKAESQSYDYRNFY
ncbi:preprotein translocase subunit SecY [Candidatus Gracilibacteria bacterium]|nr:preprotein translocase subunit SecY [Candidatus Gracilibacteria bacterium]